MNNKNVEIEAHFLDVDVSSVKRKLASLGALDLGEDFLQEIIFYKNKSWRRIFKFVRLRRNKNGVYLSLKHFKYDKVSKAQSAKPEVKEIEIKVDDWEKSKTILEEIGLTAFRQQEKKRHSYRLDGVMIEIDSWPSIPPYVEIEGNSLKEVEKTAGKLGFDWNKAVFRGAGYIVGSYLHVKVSELRFLTFDKIA